jgi:hypothetical protein
MQCAGKESGLLQAILPTLTDAVLLVSQRIFSACRTLAWPFATPGPGSDAPSAILRSAEPLWGWSHGGMRYWRPARRVQTCSGSPVAMAGVRGGQRVMAPVPGPGSRAGTGRRQLAWGQTTL